MEELKKRGTFDVDQDFLKENCPDIVKGMDKLCGWVDWWKSIKNLRFLEVFGKKVYFYLVKVRFFMKKYTFT